MKITFDPVKEAANISKHGVSLALAEELNWQSAMIWPDERRDYGEMRMRGLGYIGTRLYSVVFVERDGGYRIISFRKASNSEKKTYAQT